MRTKLNRYLLHNSLKILPGLMVASFALADQKQEMIIDIDTVDFQIESLDISHLERGDSETVYTDDGRAIDVLRTAQGIEIFVDGEKLDIPSPHVIEHEFTAQHEAGHGEVIIIKKTKDIDEVGEISLVEEAGDHEVIIIKEITHGDDD